MGVDINFVETTNRKLGIGHALVLRRLDHGAMVVDAPASADSSDVPQTESLLEDLINLDLVERKWDGDSVKYKRR